MLFALLALLVLFVLLVLKLLVLMLVLLLLLLPPPPPCADSPFRQAGVRACVVRVRACMLTHSLCRRMRCFLPHLPPRCAAFFAAEMVLKVGGLGLLQYTADAFNRFDAAIVLFSLAEVRCCCFLRRRFVRTAQLSLAH